jgi:hypothetical protein
VVAFFRHSFCLVFQSVDCADVFIPTMRCVSVMQRVSATAAATHTIAWAARNAAKHTTPAAAKTFAHAVPAARSAMHTATRSWPKRSGGADLLQSL